MSVEGVLSYHIPEETEDYNIVNQSPDMEVDPHPQLAGPASSLSQVDSRSKSNLRLPPPPLFSRQAVPHIYKLRLLRLTPALTMLTMSV